MWAIRNKRTKKWLYGTDYRRNPATQRTSHNRAITFETKEDAEHELEYRHCGKSYEIIPVEIILREDE